MPDWINRYLLAGAVLLIACALLIGGPAVGAQTERTPIPLVTLAPPTLVAPPPAPTATPLPSQSVIARIRARISTNNLPILIVGIPYNIKPFATITDTGDVDGFEADIAQAVADDWGTEIQWQQVTDENAMNMLLGGQIDLLIGQVIPSRDDHTLIDYSDPYFASKQVALALGDSTVKSINDLGGQTVGVVIGSRSEQAFNDWAKANNVQATVQRYVMLDDAIRALLNKEIVALVGDRWELDQRAGHGRMSGIKLLDGVFRVDPYAIAMVRYDDNLRTMVNRTLQRLSASGRLDPIYDHWFKDLIPAEERVIPRVWSALDDDKRALNDFQTDLVMPSQPVIDRIKAGQPLRIAGLGAPADANGKQPLLDVFNQAIVNEMARRWGVQVQIVPDSYGKAEDVLASGQADLAVGLEPHWGSVDRVDFTGIYAQHGYRLMVPKGSTAIQSFGDLFATQRQIGYFADDPAAPDLAASIAQKYQIAQIKPVSIRTDQDAVDILVNQHNVNVIFGDTLRLASIVQAYPAYVQLVDKSYGQKPVSFAVPRNDADFRELVDATLQDMYKDGTYQKIWQADFGIGDPLQIVAWPGPSTLFGIKTSG